MSTEIHLVVFTLDEQRFALPLAVVDRVIRAVEVTPLPNTPTIILGAIDVQGRIAPVINLRQRCGFPSRAPGADDRFILATIANQLVALPVDSTEVVECQPEALTGSDRLFPDFDGATSFVKDKEGLILVFDLEKLLSPREKETLVEASAPMEALA